MNIDEIQGSWEQVKGKVQEQWGKFTNDELTEAGGKVDYLQGKLQEKYGRTKEEARKELEEFFNKLKQ